MKEKMNQKIVESIVFAFSDLVHVDEVQNTIYSETCIMVPIGIIEEVKKIIEPTYDEFSSFCMFDGDSTFWTEHWSADMSSRLSDYIWEIYGEELNEYVKKIKIVIENE